MRRLELKGGQILWAIWICYDRTSGFGLAMRPSSPSLMDEQESEDSNDGIILAPVTVIIRFLSRIVISRAIYYRYPARCHFFVSCFFTHVNFAPSATTPSLSPLLYPCSFRTKAVHCRWLKPAAVARSYPVHTSKNTTLCSK